MLPANETKRHVNHHVSAHAPVPVVSSRRRRRPRICPRKIFKSDSDRLHGHLVIRITAGARGTAIRIHSHPCLMPPRVGHSRHPHAGRGHCRRQDRSFPCSILLRLDTHHDRRPVALLGPSCGARIVGTATTQRLVFELAVVHHLRDFETDV